MAYGTSYRRTYRRPYRKTYRKTAYRKKRYSKKKFTKYSTKQKTIVRAPVNARETFVKLPWQYTTLQNLAAGFQRSISYLGNSIIPLPGSYSSPIVPVTGSLFPSGATEYANFYERYRVMGSSIKLRMCCIGNGGFFHCVLIPIMSSGAETGSSVTIASRIAELDALSYDQLSVQPYAQARTLGLNVGSNTVLNFKMFRKSKYMLAVTNVKDQPSYHLPDPDGSVSTLPDNMSSAWFYYLRISNESTQTQALDLQVKMKFYCQLFGRNNWVPSTVPT